jgi:hypothetical protein
MKDTICLKYLPKPRVSKPFSDFLLGRIDLFVTFALFQQFNDFSYGVNWALSHTNMLVSEFKRITVVLPRLDMQELYRQFIKNKFFIENDCGMYDSRNYILLTSGDPVSLNPSQAPILTIDITESEPWEIFLLFDSTIVKLSRKPRFFSSKFAAGYGKPLFEQDLTVLEGAYPGRKNKSALEVLALQVLLCPSMTLQFINFKNEIQKNFNSLIMETVESKPWAAPFSDVLELREYMEAYFNKRYGDTQIPKLENETAIRDIWK